jgi:long-chain acyl-CoA synthetase
VNIVSWLTRRVEQSPNAPALFIGRACVADYAEFDRRARVLAGWMISVGTKSGDRVAIFMENAPEYLFVQYAAWYAGAVIVPINAKLHPKETAWIIENSEAALTFTNASKGDLLIGAGVVGQVVDVDDKRGNLFDNAKPVTTHVHRKSADLAWLFYTSGTTGQPKGVMITHRMLVSMSLNYVSDVDVVSDADSALYAAPLSHGAGLYNMVHVLKGARHIFPAVPGFDPADVLELIEYFGAVHMFTAPTMVKRLTQQAIEAAQIGKGLRTIVYAGGPMYQADIIEAVDHFGDIFVQIYGQGECPMGITALSRFDVSDRTHPNWQARLGSVGRVQSSVEVQIKGADGLCDTDQVGEIIVRGDTVMPGYWRNEAASAQTIVDGWLMTGDMGSIDSDGYVTLVDRSKDVIISGGSNIYPREVEEVLLTHETISEVSVVGRAHPEWGEEVVTFVVPIAGTSIDMVALDAHCLSQIARFKWPKEYIVLSELPKNNYGKVLKTELRKLL